MSHLDKIKIDNNRDYHIENKVNKLKRQVVQAILINYIEVQGGKVVKIKKHL